MLRNVVAALSYGAPGRPPPLYNPSHTSKAPHVRFSRVTSSAFNTGIAESPAAIVTGATVQDELLVPANQLLRLQVCPKGTVSSLSSSAAQFARC
jgi:hypothetical protein